MQHVASARTFLHLETASSVGITAMNSDCVAFAHGALASFVASVWARRRCTRASACWRRRCAAGHRWKTTSMPSGAAMRCVTPSRSTSMPSRNRTPAGHLEHRLFGRALSGTRQRGAGRRPGARGGRLDAARDGANFSDLAQALRIGAHWLAHDPVRCPACFTTFCVVPTGRPRRSSGC